MPAKMKIVIVGPAHPLRGGLATYNERLARAMQEDGHEVVIYSFSLQYPGILFPGKTQFTDSQAPDDINIIPAINSVNPINWLSVGNRIKKQKPDLVIFRFWLPFMGPAFGTIARIIRRNRYSRILAIADNIIPHEHRIGDKQLTRYFLKPVDGFIFMSRAVMADLDIFDIKKPRKFCPHPLYDNFGSLIEKDTAKRLINLDPELNYVLFFGFIRDYKGLDLMIRAFGDERIKKLPVKLLVAGEFYTDPEPYKNLIDEYGIAENVIMRNDFIPNDDVGKYFCASDVVAQPYKEATQSGVTQIAYHFNKPMVITNVGGLAEIVPDNKVGYVVNPEPVEIASAIYRFYTEKKETQFSKNASVEKQKYSWQRMLDAIYEVDNEVSIL